MAPRSAKGKKVADVKVAENEAPKKGRGKAKVLEDIDPEIDTEDNEQAPVIEKKTKRGKKAASDASGQQNGKNYESVPAPKRGRKKNVDPVQDDKIEEPLAEENIHLAGEDEENDENTDTNGHTEEPQTSGRGRKKQPKKETDKSASKTGRGRKPKQVAEDETIETGEKPKSGKGRGRKVQVKAEEVESDKSETAEEEIKPEPQSKGKKKPQKSKEKTPDSENEEDNDEKIDEEPKKKEVKGRKNQSKKAQAKEEGDVEAEKNEPIPKKRKVTKKEEKGKGDIKDDESVEEEKEMTEIKPVKGRRGQKKTVETQPETEEEHQNADEPTTKRRRKLPEEKAVTEDAKKKAPPKNKATTIYEDIDFTNTSKTSLGKDWNFKISCWNVDGIRAWLNKGGLDYIKYEKPDILCLQEIKCSKDKLPDELVNLPGYHAYWLYGDKEGYAGVAIYSTLLAMHVNYGLDDEELDQEGRIITAEYEQFYLVCTYVPNAGRKLVTLPKRLQWNEEFRKHVKELDKKKPVIICGDMNVSHNEIDLANPKTNRKNAGFTDEERAGMTDLLNDGFIDTFRHFNPEKTGAYTFWTYMKNSRANNVGWRLDYFLVSERLLPAISDNVIRDQVYGSDHCPITLFLHLTTAIKPKD